MFEPKKGQIPGYTGHQSSIEKADCVQGERKYQHMIPGYGGFIPAQKAENMYGETYGKHTAHSSTGAHQKGISPNAPEKFLTTSAATLVDHSKSKVPTVADIVGI